MKYRMKIWSIALAVFPIAVFASTSGKALPENTTAVSAALPSAVSGRQGAEGPENPESGGLQPGSAPSALAAAPGAPGAAIDSQTESSESDETAAIEKQKKLWKDRAEIARYKAAAAVDEARARQAAERGSPATPATSAAKPVGPLPSTFAVAPQEAFAIQFAGAFNGRWEADMIVDGRSYPSVQVGNVVGGGWKVIAITDSSVELRKGTGAGGQTKVVRF